MRSYDLGRLMEFSRYVSGGSLLHRLHPGSKLLFIALSMALLIAVRGTFVLAVACVVVVALTAAAGVPLGVPFRSLRRAAPWLLIVIVVQIFTVRGNDWGRVLTHVRVLTLHGGQLYLAVESVLRFSGLILMLSLSMAVTEPRELAYGVDALLRPFSRIRLPVRSLSLVLTVALYFVPLFAMEADRLMKSQASRGADFEGRGLVGRIRAYFPLFVPLIVTALRHAENLARAMEARGLQPQGSRTRLVVHRVSAADVASVLFGIVAVACIFIHPATGIEERIRSLF